MDLSVAIVSWNTRDLLDGCLKSIYETTTGIEFEVIVVDNAGADGSAEMVRAKYPQARLIANAENAGFAKANNQAYAASSGRCFMLLNPDTVVHNGLHGAVAFLDQHPGVAVVGAKYLNPDGSIQISWNRYYPSVLHDFLPERLRDRLRTRDPAVDADRTFECAWVTGACLTVRRDAIEQVGLLDEGYYIYTEETDWCRRFRDGGWRIMHAPDVVITHFGGQSTTQVRAQMRVELARSKIRFVGKHRTRAEARLYASVLRCIVRAKLVLAGLRSREGSAAGLAYLRELAAGYRDLDPATGCASDRYAEQDVCGKA